jgi:phosphoesterase family protein
VTETGMANLGKIDHIVVLMLENRSFDHMLGYVSLEGGRGDVDGLRAEFANEHDGRSYPVHHLDSTVIEDDPDHSASAVDLQIGGGKMSDFVESYAETLSSNDVQDADPGRVIGYYNAADVPVYDHLASEFAVCDRWFSSVPGATWPNRLYAICGRAAGSRDDRPLHLPPMYNQPSFVRHLDANGISWHWYSFEAGTLRFADGHYKLGHHDRFAPPRPSTSRSEVYRWSSTRSTTVEWSQPPSACRPRSSNTDCAIPATQCWMPTSPLRWPSRRSVEPVSPTPVGATARSGSTLASRWRWHSPHSRSSPSRRR